MTIPNSDRSFIRAIRERPADHELRVVYASWLRSHHRFDEAYRQGRTGSLLASVRAWYGPGKDHWYKTAYIGTLPDKTALLIYTDGTVMHWLGDQDVQDPASYASARAIDGQWTRLKDEEIDL